MILSLFGIYKSLKNAVFGEIFAKCRSIFNFQFYNYNLRIHYNYNFSFSLITIVVIIQRFELR